MRKYQVWPKLEQKAKWNGFGSCGNCGWVIKKSLIFMKFIQKTRLRERERSAHRSIKIIRMVWCEWSEACRFVCVAFIFRTNDREREREKNRQSELLYFYYYTFFSVTIFIYCINILVLAVVGVSNFFLWVLTTKMLFITITLCGTQSNKSVERVFVVHGVYVLMMCIWVWFYNHIRMNHFGLLLHLHHSENMLLWSLCRQ